MGLLDDLQTKFPGMSRDQILGLMDPGQANIAQGKDLNGMPMPGISAPENQAPLQFDAFGKSNMMMPPNESATVPSIQEAALPKEETKPARVPAATTKETPEEDDSDDSADEEETPKDNNDEPSKPKESFKFPSKDSTVPDTTKAFNDALASRKNAEQNAVLSKLGAQIGGAFAKASPDVIKQNMQMADAISGLGGQDLQDIKDKDAYKSQDPNSNYSQKAKQFLVDKFKVDPQSLDGLSADQLSKTFFGPALKTFEADQNRTAAQAKLDAQIQDRQDRLADQISSREFLAGENKKNRDASKNDSMSYKQQHDDEAEQGKFGKDINDLSASSRSTLGKASAAKLAAKRAMDLVDDSSSSPQDLQNVAADLNQIVSGQTTISGTQHQAYNNLSNELTKGVNYLRSDASPAEQPKVREHLKHVLTQMQKISDDVIQTNLGQAKAKHSGWIKRHPDDAQAMLDAATSSGGSSSPETVKVIDPNGVPRMIPKDQVQDALAHGGKLAQ